MDPQKQKQLIGQMFESTAKSDEDLKNMTPEERKEYLQGRLRQRMFFTTAQRRSTHQKEKMQEKMQETLNNGTPQQEEKVSKTKKKNQKRREKLKAMKETLTQLQTDTPQKESTSTESDYESAEEN
jgi:hypothetical protein